MKLVTGIIAAGAVLCAASAGASELIIPPATAAAMRMVQLHNQVRESAGVRPVFWDAALAAAADRYASELARTGRWGHSPLSTRAGQGENLWMGTRGAFGIDQMIGSWAAEGRWFRRGRFPQVSATGNWAAVGHYTQIIWPGTLRMGCAIRSSQRYDYLVCRYSPAGNVMGVIIP